MQRNRKKLYPAVIIVTLPDELKEHLSKLSAESGKAENAIIREYIKELQNGEINIKDLERYCF